MELPTHVAVALWITAAATLGNIVVQLVESRSKKKLRDAQAQEHLSQAVSIWRGLLD